MSSMEKMNSRVTEMSDRPKSEGESNTVVDIFFWLGIAGIILFMGSGLLYMFQSFWVLLVIVALGIFLIFMAAKLPQIKEDFMTDDRTKGMYIGIFAVIIIAIYPFFFHGAQIEFFKKQELRENTRNKEKSINMLLSQYTERKNARYKAHEQRLNTYLNNYNSKFEALRHESMDSIVAAAATVGISEEIVRSYDFTQKTSRDGFLEKFKRDFNRQYGSAEDLVNQAAMLSSSIEKDINKFFVLGVIETNNKIDLLATDLDQQITTVFPDIQKMELATKFPNYPVTKPLKALVNQSSAVQILVITSLFVLLNLFILYTFITAKSVGRGRKHFNN